MSLSLKELLLRWQNAKYIIQPVQLPASKTIAVIQRIVTTDYLQPLPGVDLDLLRQKLFDSAKDDDFTKLTRLDWRNSPFVLGGVNGLINNIKLLNRYLKALLVNLKPRTLQGVARTYVETFDPTSVATVELGKFLIQHMESMRGAWKRAHHLCQLFDPDQAIQNLAILYEKEVNPIQKTLESNSLPTILAHSSISLAALTLLLKKLTNNYIELTSLSTIEAIITLTSDDKGNLAMQGSSGLVEIMTNALLLPFVSSDPPKELRSKIENYLLQKLQDPRVHQDKWYSVAPKAKDVIHRWLTEQSLELFLGLVDKVTDNSIDTKRMWANRNAFWRSYLKSGHIDEAWVVLGYRGEEYAKYMTLGKQAKKLSFGVLTVSSDTSRHIALILRIDNVIILDWSHNGKCHLWTTSIAKAPRLYLPEYTKLKLEQYSNFSFTHNGHRWMSSVANIIYEQTGRRTNLYSL